MTYSLFDRIIWRGEVAVIVRIYQDANGTAYDLSTAHGIIGANPACHGWNFDANGKAVRP